MSGDSMGDRFKDYEGIAQTVLPRRAPIIVRIDGKAFHTFTRGLERPYSAALQAGMDYAARELARQVQDVRLAYTQSDEISLVLWAGGVNAQPWFAGEVQKIVSVSASIATAAFNRGYQSPRGDLALFDSRAFTVPSMTEAANYLVWRQRDAVRNSISMLAQAHFSPKQLHGRSTKEMQEMLWQTHHINWSEEPDRFKRGGLTRREVREETVTWTHKVTGATESVLAQRTHWVGDAAPHFTVDSLAPLLDADAPERQAADAH